MLRRLLAIILLLSSLSFAGIIEEVRLSLAQNNFSAAEAQLQSYRARNGANPEYLEALSWTARAALDIQQWNAAEAYARQTQSLARIQLQKRALDAEPHLPIALGAAIEVEAQALEARGRKAQAIALLRASLATYGNTSIRARIQKNLNLLSLTGRPAPPLKFTEHIGPRALPLAQLQGVPVLMFFWAHWCADCKAEGPVIARLLADYAPKGLAVVAPTQLYGYAAHGQDASPKAELDYIARIWETYYPALQSASVPVSTANFNNYGASTTPTLVLIDRKGNVSLYHPGVMPYQELRAAIENVLQN